MDGLDEKQRAGFIRVRWPTGEQLAEHAVFRVGIRQDQRRQFPCGPEPVLGKRLLQASHHWACDLHMGIAPWRQRRFFTQVFIAYVMPADKTGDAVHHDDLAMVTEVDLEAIEPATAGGECLDLHACVTQRLHITMGQGVAADAVVQDVNGHALSGFFLQQGLQLAAQFIIVNDEKLEQHGGLCVTNSLEDRAEGGIAIDQQAHFIVGQARHTAQLGHGAQGGIGAGVARCERFLHPRAPVQLGDGRVHFLVGLATGLDVRVEGAAAKNQVGDQRQVGHEHQ